MNHRQLKAYWSVSWNSVNSRRARVYETQKRHARKNSIRICKYAILTGCNAFHSDLCSCVRGVASQDGWEKKGKEANLEPSANRQGQQKLRFAPAQMISAAFSAHSRSFLRLLSAKRSFFDSTGGQVSLGIYRCIWDVRTTKLGIWQQDGVLWHEVPV